MVKRSLVLLALLTLPVSALGGQDYSGTYAIQSETGLITLTLRQDDQGQVQGRLVEEGIEYRILGATKPSGISGRVSGSGFRLEFTARLQEDNLFFKVFELDDSGQPDYETAQTLIFLRQGGAASAGEPPAQPERTPGTPPDARETAAPARNVVINGVRLSDEEVSAMEQIHHVQIQDGAYWYDKVCGAWGLQGGPTAGVILPNLDVGGSLRADASGGNTQVFVNGRELHLDDILALQQLLGPIYPGRYWLDAHGNVGIEGGPMLFNIVQLAAARGSQGGSTFRSNITDIGGGSSGGTSYVIGKDWSVITGP